MPIPGSRRMRHLVLAAIRFYQRHLSPLKGFRCAYAAHTGRASCSALGYRAVRRHGVLGGWGLLRQRLTRCGVAHRRYSPPLRARPLAQRGDCDPGCDAPCDADCDVLDFADCADCGGCDWPSRKKNKKSRREQSVYIPPRTGP